MDSRIRNMLKNGLSLNKDKLMIILWLILYILIIYYSVEIAEFRGNPYSYEFTLVIIPFFVALLICFIWLSFKKMCAIIGNFEVKIIMILTILEIITIIFVCNLFPMDLLLESRHGWFEYSLR